MKIKVAVFSLKCTLLQTNKFHVAYILEKKFHLIFIIG